MNFFKKGAVLREPIASRKSITESSTGNHEMKIKLKHQRKLDSKKQEQQYTIEQAHSAVAPHHDTNDT